MSNIKLKKILRHKLLYILIIIGLVSLGSILFFSKSTYAGAECVISQPPYPPYPNLTSTGTPKGICGTPLSISFQYINNAKSILLTARGVTGTPNVIKLQFDQTTQQPSLPVYNVQEANFYYTLNGGCSSQLYCPQLIHDLGKYTNQTFSDLVVDTSTWLDKNVLFTAYYNGQSQPPEFTWSNPIGKALSSNGTPSWLDNDGEPVDPNLESKYLHFISAQEIYDNQTASYYLTDGASQFNFKGQNFLQDGYTFYWPYSGVQHNNKCYGGIGVYTSSGTNVYPQVFLIPTQYVDGNCYIGTENNLSNNDVSNYTDSVSAGPYLNATSDVLKPTNADNSYTTGKMSDLSLKLESNKSGTDFYYTNIFLSPLSETVQAAYRMLFTPLFWNDQGDIDVFDSSAVLNDQPSSVTDGIFSRIDGALPGGGTKDNYKIFTTNDCQNQSGNYPLLLVYYNTTSTNNVGPGIGPGINSNGPDNTVGYIYSSDGNSNWTQNVWGQKADLSCLFGGNAPGHNNSTGQNLNGTTGEYPPPSSQNLAGQDSNLSIAYPSQSTSTNSIINGGYNPQPTDSTPTDVCQPGGTNLSWLVCPVLDALARAESDVESIISSLLKTPLITLGNNNCSSAPTNSSNVGDCVFKAWSNIRSIGNVLLIVGLLVAILIEAFGGGINEAYAVKKMLPRILVAAILINLSIYFIVALEDITNILGKGIFNLLKDTFYGGASWKLTPNSFSTDILGVGAGVGIAVAASGEFLAFLGTFVLLPALFAITAVMFTIIIRQGLLLVLLITSPLAFALYLLPNTQKYFAKWWDLLFKALMVYPIIMIIFAIGDIAYVLMNFIAQQTHPSWLAGLLPLIALIAPLFLIIFAFRLAGGVIGNIHQSIHAIGKKGHQSILGNQNDPNSLRNKVRRNLNIKNTQRGITWSQVGTRLNPHQVTAEGRKRASGRLLANREVATNILRNQIEQTQQWQQASKDSNILKVLAENRNGRDARRKLNELRASRVGTAKPMSDAEYNKRSGEIGVAEKIGFNAASRRAALMNSNYIGFEVAEGREGWDKSMAIINELSDGGRDHFAHRSMMDEFQAVAKNPGVGRTDISANVDGAEGYDLDRATGNQNLYTVLNGKGRGVNGLINEHLERLHDTAGYLSRSGIPVSTANIEAARAKSAAFMVEMRNSSNLNQGTGAARDARNNRMDEINKAYEAYLSDEATKEYTKRAMAGEEIKYNETRQRTVPVAGGAPGETTTTREVEEKSLGIPVIGKAITDQERRVLESSINSKVEQSARAYTPVDINNMSP